tara:strand:+ start:1266 stop:2240 length:975 start_codon:yes stop_codon:yes gene_type:complete
MTTDYQETTLPTPTCADIDAGLDQAAAEAAISVDVTTIASSASLVDMSISQWAARKKDKRASNEVTYANNAETGIANVTKDLLAGSQELKAIHDMTSVIRVFNQDMTFPWGMHNLLPTSRYFDYHKGITEMFQKWDSLVSVFLASYEWQLAHNHALAAKMGDLFDPNEYPTVDEVRSKFSYRLGYYPVPQNDWRVEMNQAGLTQMQEQFSDYVENNVKGMFTRVYDQLLVPLQNMSERLDYTDEEKAKGTHKKFRNTLVGNLIEMVDTLEQVNVTNDTELAETRMQLVETLDGVTADGLRDDAYLRRETKRKVDDIINNLPSLM